MAASATGGKKGLMVTATVVLLLSLVGAGIGFAVGIFLQPSEEASIPAPAPPQTEGKEGDTSQGHDGKPDAEASPDPQGHEGGVDESLKIVPIPPVLTTLAAPQGKWIRLEGSILARPGGDKPLELMAERAGEQILAYLRTVRLEQLQGPSGFLAIRDDLNETVRTLSKGDVQAVLIHGLIVE